MKRLLARFSSSTSWRPAGGDRRRRPPFAVQLVVLAGLGLLTFAVAVERFSKTE